MSVSNLKAFGNSEIFLTVFVFEWLKKNKSEQTKLKHHHITSIFD